MTMTGSWRSLLRERVHVARLHAARAYNRLSRPWRVPPPPTDSPAFRRVLERAGALSDISDHLPALFLEAMSASPRLIVELGVRGGDSTSVFEEVARLTGAVLVGVDVEDCSTASTLPGWHFVQEDDLLFGARFPAWCEERGIVPEIDLLFVDTVHSYEHTRRELDAWLPHLAPHGRALFHDTNQRALYRRRNGSVGIARSDRREVLAAIEERLGARFDGSRAFETVHGGFLVRHRPECNGLTVLERHPALGPTAASRAGGGA